MKSVSLFVGIDYHKDSVQVCVMDDEGRVLGNRGCGNDPEAVAKYAARYGRVRGVALESCEGTADFAEHLIGVTGWSSKSVSAACPEWASDGRPRHLDGGKGGLVDGPAGIYCRVYCPA